MLFAELHESVLAQNGQADSSAVWLSGVQRKTSANSEYFRV
jgi:hypothetical protein